MLLLPHLPAVPSPRASVSLAARESATTPPAVNSPRTLDPSLRLAPTPTESCEMELMGHDVHCTEGFIEGGEFDFDVTMGVECNRGASKLLISHNDTRITLDGFRSVRRCREACAAQVDCVAAELDQVLGTCMLWRECLHREPAMRWFRSAGASGEFQDQHQHRHQRATSGVRVMHRVGREWPVPARQVVWRANVTIVVASYKNRLDWLKTIPPTFDVAVYDKFDFGPGNAYPSPFGNASWHAGSAATTDKRLRQRKVSQAPGHNDDLYLARLAYYRVLPNYGRTGPIGRGNAANGGSREPYVYLQFILDFWDNLPNVLIFTQVDCLAWQPGCRHRYTAPRSIAMLQDWPRHWGAPQAPTQANCLCRYEVTEALNPHRHIRKLLAPMSQLLHGVFNQTIATRPLGTTVQWPMAANFAVGAATVSAAPRWFYELLLKLLVSEGWCPSLGGFTPAPSIRWAHSMERLWFMVFDPNVSKTKTWLSASQPLTAKLSCLATALEGDPKRAATVLGASAARRLRH